MRNGILYPVIVVLLMPAGALAQDARYIHFDFNQDLESILKQQLGRNADIEALLNVLKQLDSRAPGLLKELHIDPNSVQLKADGTGITTTDPELPKKLESLMERLGGVKPHEKDFSAAKKVAEQLSVKPPKAETPVPRPINEPTPPKRNVPASAKEEKVNRMTRELMKDVERSPLGDVLKKSRAWQRGLEELQRGTNSTGKGMDLAFLERWTGRLSLPEGLKLDISESLLEKIRNLRAPDLPRVNVHLPRLGGFNPIPSVNLPGIPSPGAISWQAVLTAAVVLGVAVFLWQFLARVAKSSERAARGWQPGPWPVAPDKVASPGEFIKAFEHLALLRFGFPARSWNHRRIAEGLKPTPVPGAPERLMALYEEARYAPLAQWSEAAVAAARRDLCALAGVRTA